MTSFFKIGTINNISNIGLKLFPKDLYQIKPLNKKLLILLLIVFAVIQFLRPQKNLSAMIPATDFIAMTKPSPQIETILRDACYDCHSYNTNYPWYSEVAPVSFLIAEHVKDGKKHLYILVHGWNKGKYAVLKHEAK